MLATLRPSLKLCKGSFKTWISHFDCWSCGCSSCRLSLRDTALCSRSSDKAAKACTQRPPPSGDVGIDGICCGGNLQTSSTALLLCHDGRYAFSRFVSKQLNIKAAVCKLASSCSMRLLVCIECFLYITEHISLRLSALIADGGPCHPRKYIYLVSAFAR